MKIEQLREKLRVNNTVQPLKKFASIYGEKTVSDINKITVAAKSIFDTSPSYSKNETGTIESKMKIIGITGSHGKSSVAFMIHEYFKKMGYKSVLYSSISIDSPASYRKTNEAVENPLRDEQMLLNAIEEAYAYNADYLVLEVNERAIKKGLTKDIPFDLRIITNINPTHNTFFYPDYVQVKKRFFEEVSPDDNVTCLFGGDNKDIFMSLFESNTKAKVTFMSNYVMEKRGVTRDKVNYLLTANNVFDSINGLEFIVKTNKVSFGINTKMLFPHTALNITCAIAALNTLGAYEHQVFSEFIKELVIPGVDEVFKYNNRTIIITRSISPHLEILNKYKSNGEIAKIHLVVGASGLGYKTWKKEFLDESYINEKEYSLKFAFGYADKYVDNFYITVSDSGAIDHAELLNYQASFVRETKMVETIDDRKEAITLAIKNSGKDDVVIISGRGNRRIMCTAYDNREFLLDSEIVNNIIKTGGIAK